MRTHWPYAMAAVLLMFVNWNLEALKWRLMVARIEQIGQLRAFAAICTGIAVSMFTPNRIGEFGGRVLLIGSGARARAVGISLLVSFSQLAASFALGAIGSSVFLWRYAPLDPRLTALLLLAGFAIGSGLQLAYFRSNVIVGLFDRWPLTRRWSEHIKPLAGFSFKELAAAWWLSAGRHLVFSAQYFALFLFFGIELSWSLGLILILSIFFAQTVLPSIALLELGVRSSLAVYFLGFATQNYAAVVAAALSLWIINLLVPASIGLFVVLRLNVRQIFSGHD